MIIIQISSLLLVDLANTRNARVLVGEALSTTAQSFNNQISTRNQALIQAGRLLSGDFAFKTAYASGSSRTIIPALDNHRIRIGADVMLLLSLDGAPMATSGASLLENETSELRFAFPDMIDAAVNNGQASGLIYHHGSIFSIIAVPLLTPVPSAWIVLGFEINTSFIEELLKNSQADVSIFSHQNNTWSAAVSTLPMDARTDLGQILNRLTLPEQVTADIKLGQGTFITYLSELPAWGQASIHAVLQRSQDEAMAPYYRLRLLLIALLVLAALVSILAGGAIASSVTRPVKTLVKFAGQIQRGDYHNEIQVDQKDELGKLAAAFNAMSRGLLERDKVRNLLGKVISPEIAEELINKDLQLGGEEREMTILFTDLRNFTGLSESRQPTEVLELLNEYLTRMTSVIDKYGGVVDKYIGDAIMALFGAPLELPGHADKAVACAIEMIEVLRTVNAGFRAKGWPELSMGIGINTGVVVAGNMGSRDRLNYTVIGDTVNLAARLESVTKEYGVPVIVSETTQQQAQGFNYRKLDRIKVKGKKAEVTIYTPE